MSSPGLTRAPESRSDFGDAQLRRHARSFVVQLHVALRTAHTHDRTNVIFTGALDELFQAAQQLLRGQEELKLEVILDDIYVNGNKARVDFGSFNSFKYVRETFTRVGAGGLRIRLQASKDELATLILLLARGEAVDSEDGSARLNALLRARAIETIHFEPPRASEDGRSDPDASRDRRKRALRVYEETLAFMKSEMTRFREGELINLRRGKRLVQALVDVSHDKPGDFSFAGLSAIRNFHPYTFNHIVNVCLLAIAFGKRLGLDRQQLCEVGMGALFHDVGKLCVPAEILNKKGRLDEQEWHIMRQHPVYATRQLLTLGNLTDAGLKRLLVALEHHMGYDLEGYPVFRYRRKIHLYSRMVAIVDGYDAMISHRAYSRAMLPTEALEVLLKFSGTRYDPLLVKAFINCIGLYPVGSLVLLTSGELAVVVTIHDDPTEQAQPGVRLVRSAGGRDLRAAYVDLRESDDRRVVKCLASDEHGINPATYTLWVES